MNLQQRISKALDENETAKRDTLPITIFETGALLSTIALGCGLVGENTNLVEYSLGGLIASGAMTAYLTAWKYAFDRFICPPFGNAG